MSRLADNPEWTLIGRVGVDSGQLMVCDPCYIESQWVNNGFSGNEAPLWTHEDGSLFYTSCHGNCPAPGAQDFGTFDQVIEKYGKTANALIAEGLLKESRPDPSGEFSYKGCCEATLTKDQAGQMNFKLGHEGAGVAFSSGFGDGVYDVFARYSDEGDWGRRIAEVRIVLIEEDDEEED